MGKKKQSRKNVGTTESSLSESTNQPSPSEEQPSSSTWRKTDQQTSEDIGKQAPPEASETTQSTRKSKKKGSKEVSKPSVEKLPSGDAKEGTSQSAWRKPDQPASDLGKQAPPEASETTQSTRKSKKKGSKEVSKPSVEKLPSGDAKEGTSQSAWRKPDQPASDLGKQAPPEVQQTVQSVWQSRKPGSKEVSKPSVEKLQSGDAKGISQPPQSAWRKPDQPASYVEKQAPPEVQQTVQSVWQSRKPGSKDVSKPSVEKLQSGDAKGTFQPPQSAWRKPDQPASYVEIQAPPEVQQTVQSVWQSRKPGSKDVSKPSHKKLPTGDDEKKYYQKQSLDVVSKEPVVIAPRRTEPNKQGRKIKVAANFFALCLKNPNMIVYHYDVELKPDKPKFLLKAVWSKFVFENFRNQFIPFDGVKNAYSKLELKEISTKVVVLNPDSGKNKEFIVTIKKVREVNLSCLTKNTNGEIPHAEITVLETIIKSEAFNNLIGTKKYFFPKLEHNPHLSKLSEKLEMRVGHYQAVFLGSKLYLNFSLAHKPFYKNIPILNLVELFKSKYEDLNIKELNSFIRTVKVEYKVPNDSNPCKIFRVNGLAQSAKEQTFEKENGQKITVEQYFFREKGIRLSKPNLPLLCVGPPQKSIYVPMEFCKIAADQAFNGAMDAREIREMVINATHNARDLKEQTQWVFDNCKFNNSSYFKEFGITVNYEMERVDARILNPPSLQTTRSISVSDGVWKTKDFYESKNLKKWCILNLDKYTRRENLMQLQELIKKKGLECRMNIENAERTPINVEPTFAAIKNAFSNLKNMDIVFVVISDQKGLYSKIKTICETQEGVLTQCIKGKTLTQDFRKIGTTMENLLLKVNAKLGGKNHCLERNSFPKCLEGYTMLIGADVTHPAPGSKMPSVAAVTVSCDRNAFQYGATLKVQTGEAILGLEEIIKPHLHKFQKTRGAYPEKIIFFRDGVSEGELIQVFDNEFKAIKKACTQISCNPKITLIVVQKRHNTKLYPTTPADEFGPNFNVPVGTCVDTDIVSSRNLDFYLVSHASIKGTARPTRYRLLHDENKLTDQEIEELAFYLCHMFPRCKRSVSYPSPTYNAHLAAFRGRSYLESLNISPTHGPIDIQAMMQDKISNISTMFFV